MPQASVQRGGGKEKEKRKEKRKERGREREVYVKDKYRST